MKIYESEPAHSITSYRAQSPSQVIWKMEMAMKQQDDIFAQAIITRQLWNIPPLLPSTGYNIVQSLQSCIRATRPREKLLLRSLRKSLSYAIQKQRHRHSTTITITTPTGYDTRFRSGRSSRGSTFYFLPMVLVKSQNYQKSQIRNLPLSPTKY